MPVLFRALLTLLVVCSGAQESSLEHQQQPIVVIHQQIERTVDFVISSPEPCDAKNPPQYLHLIHTAPNNAHLRRALRETWANNDLLKRVFLIGMTDDHETNDLIGQESKDHGDVFHYNLLDSYFNMTLKVRFQCSYDIDCSCPKILTNGKSG